MLALPCIDVENGFCRDSSALLQVMVKHSPQPLLELRYCSRQQQVVLKLAGVYSGQDWDVPFFVKISATNDQLFRGVGSAHVFIILS